MRFLARTSTYALANVFARALLARGHRDARVNRVRLRVYAFAISALLVLGVALPASGQGITRILVSRARVLPEFGPGIAEMRRDASGNYYLLATPASVIWIVGPHGQRLGQIPKDNTPSSKIQYAVDFDIDPNGRILVADRGANAVVIFQADGSFVSRVQVFAPTSVVALSDGEFAVTTLRTKRLVLILNDKGDQIRSFGDPADAGVDVSATPLESLGRISGDSANGVYFAFTTLATPTIRKFDRFGYSHGDATVTNDQLVYKPPEHEDRVQFGFNVSELNFSSMLDGGAMIGTSGDIHLSGGVGTGLGGRIGGGGGPATGAGLMQTLLSAGMGDSSGGGSGRGSGRGGGMLTGQAAILGDGVRLNLGPGNGASASGGNSDDASGSGSFKLRFTEQDAFDTTNAADTQWLDAALADFQNAQLLDPGNGYGLGPEVAGGAGTNGLGTGVLTGLGGAGMFGGIGGGMGGAHSFASGASHGAGVGGGPRPGGGGYGGFGGFGPHGHFGDMTNFTATVKVNLDPQLLTADEKPVVTAVGVDPQSQDIWAGIGKALMHFDKNGTLLDSYVMAAPDGGPLRAKAIVVEPDQLIIASDPRGIFVFERPDKADPVVQGQRP